MKHFILLELFKKKEKKKSLITAVLISILGLIVIFFINGANHSALIIFIKQVLFLLLLGIFGIFLHEICLQILQKKQRDTVPKTIIASSYFIGIFVMFSGLTFIDGEIYSLKTIMLNLLFAFCVCAVFYVKTHYYLFKKHN